MALFDQYNDESEFRLNFVKPLLHRLGFSNIFHNHGNRERGADFIFSEPTRFGLQRHSAAVVKHEKSIGQSTQTVTTILSQVEQAFNTPHKTSDSNYVRPISSVYVMNSGKITPEAVEQIQNHVTASRYGANVHIFGGEALQSGPSGFSVGRF